MPDTLSDIRRYDEVDVIFKPTLEARSAVRQLWAMHGDGFINTSMLTLSVGKPGVELPDEECWTYGDWQGRMIRSFVFTANANFDVERFERELHDHIETIKIRN